MSCMVLAVFNYSKGKYELDNDGFLAASMLVHHYCRCWAPLVSGVQLFA